MGFTFDTDTSRINFKSQSRLCYIRFFYVLILLQTQLGYSKEGCVNKNSLKINMFGIFSAISGILI